MAEDRKLEDESTFIEPVTKTTSTEEAHSEAPLDEEEYRAVFLDDEEEEPDEIIEYSLDEGSEDEQDWVTQRNHAKNDLSNAVQNALLRLLSPDLNDLMHTLFDDEPSSSIMEARTSTLKAMTLNQLTMEERGNVLRISDGTNSLDFSNREPRAKELRGEILNRHIRHAQTLESAESRSLYDLLLDLKSDPNTFDELEMLRLTFPIQQIPIPNEFFNLFIQDTLAELKQYLIENPTDLATPISEEKAQQIGSSIHIGTLYENALKKFITSEIEPILNELKIKEKDFLKKMDLPAAEKTTRFINQINQINSQLLNNQISDRNFVQQFKSIIDKAPSELTASKGFFTRLMHYADKILNAITLGKVHFISQEKPQWNSAQSPTFFNSMRLLKASRMPEDRLNPEAAEATTQEQANSTATQHSEVSDDDERPTPSPR